MSANRETFGKTIGVVVAVCFVCSIVVSGAAIGLRDQQKANAKLDIQTNILEAAGLLAEAGRDIPATFETRVESKFVDLATGEFVDMDENYDQRKAARDPALSIKPANDVAKVLRRPNVARAYLVRGEQGNVETVILPVNGAGLWNMMYAFLAIEVDGSTAKNMIYYEQGETPGLGAEVLNPSWKAQWNGKQLFNKQGDIAIKIVKGGAKAGDIHGVDGLSGATLTSNGIQYTLDYWLGSEGFGHFLAKKPWQS